MTEPLLLPLGQLFGGKYRILEHLGSGGMAQVFRVENQGKIQALKVLKPAVSANPVARSTFFCEAKIMQRLKHPHIVRVYESGQIDAIDYFLMEFIDGWSAMDQITNGVNTPTLDILRTGFELLQAVGAAHLGGVIHRDIKPSNLLLSLGGAKLSDFGIARSAENQSLTVTGTMGTMGFMAPEQRRDAQNIGKQADLYSVGATLFAMIARRPPGQLEEDPLGSAPLDKIPLPIRPVIQRATRPNPRDRYNDAREMALALALARDQLAADWDQPRVADEWMDEFDRHACPQPIPTVSLNQRPKPSEFPDPTQAPGRAIYGILGVTTLSALIILITLLVLIKS